MFKILLAGMQQLYIRPVILKKKQLSDPVLLCTLVA